MRPLVSNLTHIVTEHFHFTQTPSPTQLQLDCTIKANSII